MSFLKQVELLCFFLSGCTGSSLLCVDFSLVVTSRGYSLVVVSGFFFFFLVSGFFIVVFSLVVEHGL